MSTRRQRTRGMRGGWRAPSAMATLRRRRHLQRRAARVYFQWRLERAIHRSRLAHPASSCHARAMKKPRFLALILLTLVAAPLRAHESSAEMAAAANALLVTLTPEQKQKASFEYPDEERKN